MILLYLDPDCTSKSNFYYSSFLSTISQTLTFLSPATHYRSPNTAHSSVLPNHPTSWRSRDWSEMTDESRKTQGTKEESVAPLNRGTTGRDTRRGNRVAVAVAVALVPCSVRFGVSGGSCRAEKTRRGFAISRHPSCNATVLSLSLFFSFSLSPRHLSSLHMAVAR